MGANTSEQLIDSTSDLVSEVMNKMSTTVETKTSTYTGSFQIMKVEFSNMKIVGCGILLEQHATVNVSALLNNTTTLTTDLSTEIMSTIKEEMKNTIKQKNEKLNLGQANVSKAITKGNTYLEQNLTNDISVGISNSLKQTTEGTQVIDFNMKDSEITCSPGGIIKVSQTMIIDAIAKNIAKSIVDNGIENIVTGELEKAIKNKAKQLNKGIDIKFIVIVCVIIASCIGLSYLGIKFGGGGKKMKKMIQMKPPGNQIQQSTDPPQQSADPPQQSADPPTANPDNPPTAKPDTTPMTNPDNPTGGDGVDDDEDGLNIGMIIAGGAGLSGMTAIGILYTKWFLPQKKEISDTYDTS
jgi:hypothetical protein